MENSFNSAFSRALPVTGNSFIAPYWGDADLSGIGEVSYRQTNSPVLLARAKNEIQKAFSHHDRVNITNLFIATWDTVGYSPLGTNRVRLLYVIVWMVLSVSN